MEGKVEGSPVALLGGIARVGRPVILVKRSSVPVLPDGTLSFASLAVLSTLNKAREALLVSSSIWIAAEGIFSSRYGAA